MENKGEGEAKPESKVAYKLATPALFCKAKKTPLVFPPPIFDWGDQRMGGSKDGGIKGWGDQRMGSVFALASPLSSLPQSLIGGPKDGNGEKNRGR